MAYLTPSKPPAWGTLKPAYGDPAPFADQPHVSLNPGGGSAPDGEILNFAEATLDGEPVTDVLVVVDRGMPACVTFTDSAGVKRAVQANPGHQVTVEVIRDDFRTPTPPGFTGFAGVVGRPKVTITTHEFGAGKFVTPADKAPDDGIANFLESLTAAPRELTIVTFTPTRPEKSMLGLFGKPAPVVHKAQGRDLSKRRLVVVKPATGD